MVNVEHNAKLNRLLIAIGRSLLQYVGHCSSWTSRSDQKIAEEFPSLVAAQQEHVAELAELLISRRWSVDYGGFPAQFTDLHFLSLKYLLKIIVTNQKSVLNELEDASHTCVDDPEAATLIEEILSSERQITERLELLGKPGVAA